MKIILFLFVLAKFDMQNILKSNPVSLLVNVNDKFEDTTIVQQPFEIIKIDSVKKVYVIYAQKNGSVYKIVSKKECVYNCRNVVIGKKFAFNLTPLLDSLPNRKHIAGVRYNNTIIKIEGGNVIWDLFTCKELDNLCFTPSSQ